MHCSNVFLYSSHWKTQFKLKRMTCFCKKKCIVKEVCYRRKVFSHIIRYIVFSPCKTLILVIQTEYQICSTCNIMTDPKLPFFLFFCFNFQILRFVFSMSEEYALQYILQYLHLQLRSVLLREISSAFNTLNTFNTIYETYSSCSVTNI